MKRLSRRQLLISLIFPVGITVWTAAQYIVTIIMFGVVPVYAIQWGYLLGLLFCGVLPIILTVTLGIDTGQYIVPRVLISVLALAFSSMAGEFLTENTGAVIFFILLVFNVFSVLYFYRIRPTKFTEWIVIFLSNPCLVRLIEYFTQSLTYRSFFDGA